MGRSRPAHRADQKTQTGKTAVLHPTPALLELLASFKSQPKAGADHGHRADDEQLEAIARKIATMPEREIATVTMDEAAK